MSKTVRVHIGGREYPLVGDDEDLIRATAQEVNEQLDFLSRSNLDLSANVLPVLAALNIAESKLTIEQKRNTEIDFITNEISKMAEILNQAMST